MRKGLLNRVADYDGNRTDRDMREEEIYQEVRALVNQYGIVRIIDFIADICLKDNSTSRVGEQIRKIGADLRKIRKE